MIGWITKWASIENTESTHNLTVRWGKAIMPRWSYLLRKQLEEVVPIVEITNSESGDVLMILSEKGLSDLRSILLSAELWIDETEGIEGE